MKHKIIWGFVLFLLLYNESTVNIGGLPLSQVWKVPIILYMIFVIIKNRVRRPAFSWYGYAYGLVKLVNPAILKSISFAVGDMIRFVSFSVFFDYLLIKLKRVCVAKDIILFLARFVTLSFVPFLFGLLDNDLASQMTNESAAEIIEEAGKLCGIFTRSHGASSIAAIALVVLFYFHKREKKSMRQLDLVCILLGLWGLLRTYARGGWLMLVVGLFILYCRHLNMKKIMRLVAVGLVILYGIVYLAQTNEYFYNRLTDKNEQGVQNSKVGSGRLFFTANGINFWLDSENAQQYLIGQGYDALCRYQEKISGLYIYCHNGFVDALAQNGLLGFLFMLLFNLYLLRYIRRFKNSPSYDLGLAIVLMEITFQLVQGGHAPFSDFYYVAILHFVRLSSLQHKTLIVH